MYVPHTIWDRFTFITRSLAGVTYTCLDVNYSVLKCVSALFGLFPLFFWTIVSSPQIFSYIISISEQFLVVPTAASLIFTIISPPPLSIFMDGEEHSRANELLGGGPGV